MVPKASSLPTGGISCQLQPVGQTFAADFLRRIDDRRAILADRHLERATRRGGRKPPRDTAANAWRQIGATLHMVAPFWKMIAPVQRPRS